MERVEPRGRPEADGHVLQAAEEITRELLRYAEGEAGAFDRVVDLVYRDLRRLARRQLRRYPRRHLETTALVHELYIRFASGHNQIWRNRGHFYAASAKAMRHILVDEARRVSRVKRGGSLDPEPLTDRIADQGNPDLMLRVDDALNKLAEHDPRMAQVFECRFFAGYSSAEVADIFDTPRRTVQRDWTRACAWLRTIVGS
ncbi:MAG: ECF-type sigma factor [Thermoanaerobaculia bacterium]|nr:ECF-type sigma factor [Thermoanaerobaculia bacterium]